MRLIPLSINGSPQRAGTRALPEGPEAMLAYAQLRGPPRVTRVHPWRGFGCERRQKSLVLSRRKVTGPSLMLLTCMWAPNEPFSTLTSERVINSATFS